MFGRVSNAIAILIPCHRVVKKDGSISGYAGAFAESAFCSNASGRPNSSGKSEDMMSDKCAPALDASVEEQGSFGSFGKDSVQTSASLALADPERAKERFPAYRLTPLVTARFDVDDTEARIFADLARPLATVRLVHDTAPFNNHLRDAILRFGLTLLFCDNGRGRHHADAVNAWGMERWRADYRAMTAAQQMLTASIIWLYRGGKDNRWLRCVPCTWHAADAINEMRRRDVLAHWGRLISLYPGW